jgi:hypothetical protein
LRAARNAVGSAQDTKRAAMNRSANSSAELAIRTRRAAFNRAIADGDLAAISPLLGRDVVMVTGSDSAVVSGRNTQLKVWKREFASPARAVYTRTPDRVVVSGVEPIALEYGQWQGIEDRSGKSLGSGSYTAKWREVLGEWVIVAEIYVTLA